jgi:transcriptional regulator with XRE-family HTH domain
MKKRIVNQVFIERCNKLKDEKGFSLEAIETETGIGGGMMSKYMNGIHLPNSEVIKSLAKYWGVSSDYLLGVSSYRNNEETIPIEYAVIVKEAITLGISADEFKQFLDMAKKLKGV